MNPEAKEIGSSGQTFYGISLVIALTIATAVLAYGLTGAGANSVSMTVGGLAAYVVVWMLALWFAKHS
jgi:hypothetical protein